jgi:hypothetical protein
MANQLAGKAASENPALKPYWGKPAVRNFRGGNGNVGIIRSPVRAIALPDCKGSYPCRQGDWSAAHTKNGEAGRGKVVGIRDLDELIGPPIILFRTVKCKYFFYQTIRQWVF